MTDTIDADRGTGKLARWFEGELPEACRMWGVVRQQLLVDPAIPYTSHNSSACAVVECADLSFLPRIIEIASRDIEAYALPGSELEQIANAVGAELILLTHGDKKFKDEDVEVKE